MKKSKTNFLILSLVSILICGALFEGSCILFGADVVFSFCVGTVVIVGLIALPLLKASQKPRPYWERN